MEARNAFAESCAQELLHAYFTATDAIVFAENDAIYSDPEDNAAFCDGLLASAEDAKAEIARRTGGLVVGGAYDLTIGFDERVEVVVRRRSFLSVRLNWTSGGHSESGPELERLSAFLYAIAPFANCDGLPAPRELR